jgi:large subunit ribosomal protein L10
LPLLRSEKETVVQTMTRQLAGAEAVLAADYRGLNVAQLRQLRLKLRDHNAEFHVIKNTLARRAFAAAGLEAPDALLHGPTALTVLHDDLSGPAKVLLQVADSTGLLTIKGGLLGGRVIDAEGVAALSRLPSRPELLSQLLGVLKAPQRCLVTVLNAPLVDLVGVLKAYGEKEAA